MKRIARAEYLNVACIWFFAILYFLMFLASVRLIFVNPSHPFSVVFFAGILLGAGMFLLCSYLTFDYIANSIGERHGQR